MSRTEGLRRYIIFFLGLVFVALGISFTTKAMLGTSPISSIPYSLSLVLPQLSLGNWTILFNALLIIIQWILLKKDAKKIELLLQLVLTFIFGYVIDLTMFCISALNPVHYIAKVLVMCFGCVILAFGVYLEVLGDVVMLPGDAFARVIAKITKKEFGTIRMISDTTMVIIAAIICLVELHALVGVREGTIFAALTIGNIVKFYTRHLKKFAQKLLPPRELREETENS
ncbi:MAG: YitT family protein [Clostridia bacterium]